MSEEEKNNPVSPTKDFVQWLSDDGLPEAKSILAELKAINAKREEEIKTTNQN